MWCKAQRFPGWSDNPPIVRIISRMAKYDPLRSFLRSSDQPRVAMTFDQIAALVGPLPKSAHEYQAWWANEVNPTTHVQKIAWQSAGYIVDRLSLPTRTVTFVRR